MATYKKKGSKKEQQQAIEDKSTTAEVFNTLDQSASRTEQWIENNSRPLFYSLIAVVVLVLATLGYNKYIVEPTELTASNELAFPRKYFNEAKTAGSEDVDSLLILGLEGTAGKFGFLDIATTYGSTQAGNMAQYYAGVSYLKLKKYDLAVAHLSEFSSDDLAINAISLGAIGDAFADVEQYEDAIDYYEKAAKKENNYTSPLFLFKAAQLAMVQKDFSKAERLFSEIKSTYPKSEQGIDIEKYINSATYAQ